MISRGWGKSSSLFSFKYMNKKKFTKNKKEKRPDHKVEALNTKAEYTCKGVSYHGLTPSTGNFMLGDKGFEYYNEKNVHDFIQIPWENLEQAGANVHGRKVSRHFELYTDSGKFLFSSKESGKILKIIRQYIGNENVIRLRTMIQVIIYRIKKFFTWVSSKFRRIN